MKIYTRNGDKGERDYFTAVKFPRILRFQKPMERWMRPRLYWGWPGPNVKEAVIWKTRLSTLKGIFTY